HRIVAAGHALFDWGQVTGPEPATESQRQPEGHLPVAVVEKWCLSPMGLPAIRKDCGHFFGEAIRGYLDRAAARYHVTPSLSVSRLASPRRVRFGSPSLLAYLTSSCTERAEEQR